MSGLSLHLDCAAGEQFRLQLACELPATGITAIYGPSGSGKSTLLDCIAGLRRAAADSEIRFRGEYWQRPRLFVPPWQRRTAYVFQDARLFPHLNVEQNLRYALRRRHRDRGVSLAQVVSWLQLDDLLAQHPASLSAGQAQRVAIARALLSAPELMLLDEPLANLDHAASQQIIGQLQQLNTDLELPMLYVSHDIEEVSQLADQLVLLEQGRLAAQGSLLDLCSRLDTRLSREDQAAAIVVGTTAHHDARFSLTELDVEGQPLLLAGPRLAPGQLRRLRIPARDVSVQAAANRQQHTQHPAGNAQRHAGGGALPGAAAPRAGVAVPAGPHHPQIGRPPAAAGGGQTLCPDQERSAVDGAGTGRWLSIPTTASARTRS